jgi:hypothetical protein
MTLTPSGQDHANSALRTLVGAALRNELGHSVPPASGTYEAVSADLIASHRVDHLLTNHHEQLALPDDIASAVKDRAVAHAVAGLKLITQTAEVCELFGRSDIDFLVYKGVALAATSGRRSASRGAGDVDVLVAPDDVPRAHRLLLAEGFTPRTALEPREGALWRFWSYRERELSYSRGNVSLDLHWRIPKEPALMPPTRALLTRTTGVSIGEHTVPTLDPSDALCAAATTVYLDYCQNLRLISDVVFLSQLPGAHIPEDLPTPGRALVSDVLEFTRVLLGRDLVPEIPGSLEPHPRGVSYLLELWNHNSSRSLHSAGPGRKAPEVIGRFGHWMRYGRGLPTALRFISWAAIDLPPYSANAPSTTLGRALGRRIKQTLHRDFDYVRKRSHSTTIPRATTTP